MIMQADNDGTAGDSPNDIYLWCRWTYTEREDPFMVEVDLTLQRLFLMPPDKPFFDLCFDRHTDKKALRALRNLSERYPGWKFVLDGWRPLSEYWPETVAYLEQTRVEMAYWQGL